MMNATPLSSDPRHDHDEAPSPAPRLWITFAIVIVGAFLIELLILTVLPTFQAVVGETGTVLLDAMSIGLVVAPLVGVVFIARHPLTITHAEGIVLGRHGMTVAVCTLLCGTAATIIGVWIAEAAARQIDEARFMRLSERVHAEIERRVGYLAYGLRGARGLWPASKSVERGEFAHMAASLILPVEFPGALGIGYVKRVRREGVEEFLKATRADDAPEFEIKTSGDAADLFVIEFIEPLENNRPIQGFDVGSQAKRRQAAERAMLTGEPSITEPITLVQVADTGLGWNVFLPVYKKNTPATTPDERRAALDGWTFMPVLARQCLHGVLQDATGGGELDFDVFSGDAVDLAMLLYDADGIVECAGTATNWESRRYVRSNRIKVGGQTWTVVASTTPDFITASRAGVWAVAAGGTFVTLLAMGLVISLSRTAGRAKQLAEGMTRELAAAYNAAEAASKTKSEFLANMSHEVRTPMTAILGFADLLLEEQGGALAAEQRLEYIDAIRRNGEHLLNIINDILDLSKIEAGKMTVERIGMSPVQELQNVTALLRGKAVEKDVTLEVVRDATVPTIIQSDPVRIRQILFNLIGNAIKFTEVGGVTVRIGLDTDAPGGPALRVEVADTGIGLSPEQMSRLFEAFAQADTTTTRKFGGTGLGLRICKSLAELIGGDITVKSEPGKGSTFTLTVPIGPLDESLKIEATGSNRPRSAVTPAVPAPHVTAADLPLEGLRVFLAEDGPDNQRLIKFHLTKAGAEVTVFDNGLLCFKALTKDGDPDGPLAEDTPCDLIVTDMQMTEMDGYTLARTLRDKGWTGKIVALTAHVMTGDAEKCLDAGCDDYVAKPIDKERLIAACDPQRDPADDQITADRESGGVTV